MRRACSGTVPYDRVEEVCSTQASYFWAEKLRVQVSLFFVVVFSVSCGYGHLPLRGAVQMTLNTPGTPLISVLAVPWSSGQRMFDEVLMTKAQQGH